MYIYNIQTILLKWFLNWYFRNSIQLVPDWSLLVLDAAHSGELRDAAHGHRLGVRTRVVEVVHVVVWRLIAWI